MKRFLVVLVLVAAGVIVAAFQVPSQAASVNGASISRQSVNNDLAAVSSNPNYECFVRAELALSNQTQSQIQIGGAGSNGTYDVNFADYAVDQLIDDQLIAQTLQAHGLQTTSSDLAIGRTLLNQRVNAILTNYGQSVGLSAPPCGGSASAVLSSLPTAFLTELVNAQTEQAVLEAHAVGSSLGTDAAVRYFNAHLAAFDTVCVSDIAVTSQSQAAFIRSVIVSGSSTFAAQAQANSIDTSTKANGGAAGCEPAVAYGLSQLVNLPIGQVSQPVSTNGAYVLLTVTSRTPGNFAAVQSLVRSAILAAGQTKVQTQLVTALRRSNISADPRYGQVVPGSTILLVPPASPPPSSLVSPQANIPSATGVSG